MLQVPQRSASSIEVVAPITFIVPSAVVVGDLVYSTGINSVDRADNTVLGTMPAMGLCVGKQSPTLADVIYLGDAAFYVGLTPGATQYVGKSGARTEITPIGSDIVQEIGVALNTTTILFRPKLITPGIGSGHAPWFEDEFTPTLGQITFILTQAPIDSTSLGFYVNGVLVDDVSDYAVSGVTVTWLNTYQMAVTDKVHIRFQ